MATNKIDVYLFRGFVVAATLLLCMSSYFIWRVSMIALRTEQSIQALSADLQKVTGTAANVAEKVDELMVRVARLEDSVKDKYRKHKDDLTYLKEKVKELKAGGKEAVKAEAKKAATKLWHVGKGYLKKKLTPTTPTDSEDAEKTKNQAPEVEQKPSEPEPEPEAAE